MSVQFKLSHSSEAGIMEVWLHHILFRGIRVNGMKANKSRESWETSLCSTEPKHHWLPWAALSGFDNISINIEMSVTLRGHSSAVGLTSVWRRVSVMQQWACLWLNKMSSGAETLGHITCKTIERNSYNLCRSEHELDNVQTELEGSKWKRKPLDAQWARSIKSKKFLPAHSALLSICWQRGQLGSGCLSFALQCAHRSAHSAGLVSLRSLPITEPWPSSSYGWLNKPHTLICSPWSCSVALDTLLYTCLNITSIHWLVWLWCAAWLASMTALCFSPDQMASLMAQDDDTEWNLFHRCSKATLLGAATKQLHGQIKSRSLNSTANLDARYRMNCCCTATSLLCDRLHLVSVCPINLHRAFL